MRRPRRGRRDCVSTGAPGGGENLGLVFGRFSDGQFSDVFRPILDVFGLVSSVSNSFRPFGAQFGVAEPLIRGAINTETPLSERTKMAEKSTSTCCFFDLPNAEGGITPRGDQNQRVDVRASTCRCVDSDPP